MKILKLVTALVIMGLFQNSFAIESLPVYITNNTSHTMHLLNTAYSKTPLNFAINTIPPYSGKTKVATIDFNAQGEIDIKFLVYPENELHGLAPLIYRKINAEHSSFGVRNLETCVNNRRNDCIAVDFSMFSSDMDFEIIPIDPILKEQYQKNLMTKWSHVPNVTAHFDFNKNEMTLTQKH